MATYPMGVADVAVHAKTLTANVEDTVTCARRVGRVELRVKSGTADVYFTVDSRAATVEGGQCYVAGPGEAVTADVEAAGNTTVRLISTATAVYSVSVS